MSSLRSDAQIGGLDAGVGEERRGGILQHDLSGFQHIAAPGQPQRKIDAQHERVLHFKNVAKDYKAKLADAMRLAKSHRAGRGTIGGGGIAIGAVGVGKKLAVIANKEQQLLLPNMRDCFIEDRFVKMVGAKGWFDNGKFMLAMNITRFDSKVLASYVSSLLPKEWEGKERK